MVRDYLLSVILGDSKVSPQAFVEPKCGRAVAY